MELLSGQGIQMILIIFQVGIKMIYHKVNFNNFQSWQPDYAIETIKEDEDWYELLEKGKFGRPKNLRQHLTHIYLSGKLANLVYSMEATNTDFYAYQFKPVLSFLESPTNALLIADEVGLGKTIEAGLVWTEIKARENANRLLFGRSMTSLGRQLLQKNNGGGEQNCRKK